MFRSLSNLSKSSCEKADSESSGVFAFEVEGPEVDKFRAALVAFGFPLPSSTEMLIGFPPVPEAVDVVSERLFGLKKQFF